MIIMEVEYISLKVPFERLSNVFRNTTRLVEKEIESILNSISNLKNQSSSIQKKVLIEEVNHLINKIETLKTTVYI